MSCNVFVVRDKFQLTI